MRVKKKRLYNECYAFYKRGGVVPQAAIDAEMMRRFGSWSEYRTAPLRIVEEQIQDWLAYTQARGESGDVSDLP